MVSAERLRLDEADMGGVPWRCRGPYLSERQWGTVREDYGSGGDTWWTGAEGLRAGGRGAIKSAAAGGRTGAAR